MHQLWVFMNYFLKFFLILIIVSGQGCKNVLKKDSDGQGPKNIMSATVEVVDLATLKSDLAIINTKFSKLSLDCAYVTKAVKFKFLRKSDKQLLKGLVSWDLLRDPAVKKKLVIEHTNLNLKMDATLLLEMSLNSSFDAVINVTPQVSVKTLKSNGKTLTSTVYNPNPADIYDQETLVIIDTTIEDKKTENDSYIKLECTLNSMAKPQYIHN